ncbi:hypothetical protein AB4Z52_29905 [Rhizobium sp. 2YAF20]|uniref:hypothetical protein n=1 Tax=Rhizobium sp. 2YAF20 TaxID=3233027 RepID=UPI003F94AAB8
MLIDPSFSIVMLALFHGYSRPHVAAVDLNSLSDNAASLAVANATLCLIAAAKRYG